MSDEKTDLEKWDMDDDWNDGGEDLGFTSPPPPKGRTAVITSAAASAVGGEFFGKGKLRKHILKSLPDDYSTAFTAYDGIADVTKDIYSTSKEEIRKANITLKRATRQAMPLVAGALPKGIRDKINRWSEDTEYAPGDQIDQNQASIDTSVAAIFDQHAQRTSAAAGGTGKTKDDKEAFLEEHTREEIKTNLRDKLSRNTVKLLTNISRNSDVGISYQNTITTDYRRKMIELAHRQTFGILELVSLTKAAGEKMLPAIEAIQHNTALPDYAKENLGEIARASMKRKLISSMSPIDAMANYGRELGGNITAKIKDIGSIISEVSGEVGDNIELANGMSDEQVDLTKLGTEEGTAWLTRKLYKEYGKKHVDKFLKFAKGIAEANPTISKYGKKAAHFGSNLSRGLNEVSKNPWADVDTSSVTSMLGALLKSSLPSYNGEVIEMSDDLGLHGSGPRPYDQDTTINVTIPGLLAKIDQSVRALGSDGPQPLEEYDYTRKEFVSTDDTTRDIRHFLNNQEHKDKYAKSLDEEVDKLVKGKEISPEDKATLKALLDKKTRTGGSMDISALNKNIGMYDGLDGGYELNDWLATQDADDFNNSIDNAMRNLSRNITTNTDRLDTIRQRYGDTALIRAGILKNTTKAGENTSGYGFGNLDLDTSIFDNDFNVNEDVPSQTTPGKSFFNQATPQSPNRGPKRQRGFMDFGPKTVNNGPSVSDIVSGVQAGVTAAMGDLFKDETSAKSDKFTHQDHVLNDSTLKDILEQLKLNHNIPQLETLTGIVENLELKVTNINVDGVLERGGNKLMRGSKWAAGKLANGGRRLNIARKRTARWIKRNIPNPLGSLGSTISGTWDGVKSFAQGIKGPRDIYDAAKKVVFEANLLKADHYFNSDGEAIHSIKDIKGAVYDKDGNIIYSAEKIREIMPGLRIYIGGKWSKLNQWVGDKLGGTIGRSIKVPTAVLTWAKDKAKGVMAQADIYVKGEATPRLTRINLLRGVYMSQTTGKIIRKFADIDGPIVLTKNPEQYVITLDEITDPKFELVDVWGNKISKLSDRLKKWGVGALKLAWKVAKVPFNLAKKGFSVASKAAKGIKDFAMTGVEAAAGKVTGVNGRLDKIYKLLDARLGYANGGPGTKSKRGRSNIPGMGGAKGFTDTPDPKAKGYAGKNKDSAGNRAADSDGDGYRDNSFRDQANTRKTIREKLRERMAGAKDKYQSAKDKVGAKASGMLDAAGSVFAGSALGDILSGISGVFSAGIGKLAASIGSMISLGGMASSIGGSIASGAAWLAGGTATALGWVATGTLAVLSSPAVLIAGAVALVIGAGYLAYRASVPAVNPFDSFRYMQYGIDDFDVSDNDDIARVAYLESAVAKYVSYDGRGVATIKGLKQQDMEKIITEFGVDIYDEAAMKVFNGWFYTRFVGIYLLWLSRIKQITPDKVLKDIGNPSKFNSQLALTVANRCRLSPKHQLYKVAIGPFDDDDLIIDPEDIDEYQAELFVKMVALANKADKARSKTARNNSETGAVRTARLIDDGKTWWRGDEGEDVVSNGYNNGVTVRGKHFDTYERYVAARKSAIRSNLLDAVDEGEFRITESTNLKLADKTGREVSSVSALDAIRLRAYGLIDLDVEQIDQLFKLEEAVYGEMVDVSGIWTYKGDIGKLFKANAGAFGVSADNVQDKNAWVFWVTNRFLPVLSTFISVLKRHASSAQPFSLVTSSASPYILKVALAIIDTKVGKANVPVWSVLISPWPGKYVNADRSSTDANVEYIRGIMKASKADEQLGDPNLKAEKPKNTTSLKTQAITNFEFKTKSLSELNSWYDPDSQKPRDLKGSGEVDFKANQHYNLGTGDTVDGEGGAYQDIKQPDANQAEIAEMIKQIASMVGVNPNLLLSIAQVESGLNPGAKAGSSTAGGLFQFIDSTWREQIAKHGNKYGLPKNASKFDPVANALMGAEYIKSGASNLKSAVSRPLTPTDMYMSHFMGEANAARFLKELDTSPTSSAVDMFSKASAANPSIFYDKTGGARSVAQVYGDLQRRMRNSTRQITQYLGGNAEVLLAKNAVNDTDDHRAKLTALKGKSIINRVGAKTRANTAAPTAPMADDQSMSTKDIEDIKAKALADDSDASDLAKISKYSKQINTRIVTERDTSNAQLEQHAKNAATAHIQGTRVTNRLLLDSLAEHRITNKILNQLANSTNTASNISAKESADLYKQQHSEVAASLSSTLDYEHDNRNEISIN